MGDSGYQIGEGTLIRSALDQFGHLVVSCRTKTSAVFPALVLITFSISPSGVLIRLGDSHSQAGDISQNANMARPYGVLSAVAT